MEQKRVEALTRLAKTNDGAQLIAYLDDLAREHADVRKLTNLTPESIIGRQIALQIIEDMIINPLKRLKNDQPLELIDDYQ